jgi:hypothetical protein
MQDRSGPVTWYHWSDGEYSRDKFDGILWIICVDTGDRGRGRDRKRYGRDGE